MGFPIEYVSTNLISLLLLIGIEFMLFMNRTLPSVSARRMHSMAAVILLISLSSSLETYRFAQGLLPEFVKSLSWLGGQFYFIMCCVIIPIRNKKTFFLPQLLNIAACTILTLIPGAGLENHNIANNISSIVTLFYLFCLTCYAFIQTTHRKYTDSFMILYIVSTSLLMVLFSKMDFARGYLDEVASINLLLYYGYHSAVAQREMQTSFLENKLELSQSKMTVLMAQIQPHFIFNSLMAIQAQCIDYPEVYDSLDSFAHYLRSNFDSLGDTKPVSFSRELENIEAYLALEKLNFGERLRVERDIETEDFFLPALSVEPLVENAVRHGTATFEGGGTVRIIVRTTKHFTVVEIRDKGEGRRTLTEKQKKRRGIGIENVRARLAESSMGRLEIISDADGTCARLILNRQDGSSDEKETEL